MKGEESSSGNCWVHAQLAFHNMDQYGSTQYSSRAMIRRYVSQKSPRSTSRSQPHIDCLMLFRQPGCHALRLCISIGCRTGPGATSGDYADRRQVLVIGQGYLTVRDAISCNRIHAISCKTKVSWFVCILKSRSIISSVELGWLRHAETFWLNGWPLGRRGRLQQYYPQLQPGRANRSKGVYGKDMSDMQDLHRSPSWHVSGRGCKHVLDIFAFHRNSLRGEASHFYVMPLVQHAQSSMPQPAFYL